MKKIISGLLISTMLFTATSAFAAEEKTPGACGGGKIKIETSINGTTVTTSTDANGKLITTTDEKKDEVKEVKDETDKTFFEKYFKEYVINLVLNYIRENPKEVRRLLENETANPTVESAETVK